MGLRTSEKPRRDLDGDAGFYEREQLGYRPSEAGGGILLCGSTASHVSAAALPCVGEQRSGMHTADIWLRTISGHVISL